MVISGALFEGHRTRWRFIFSPSCYELDTKLTTKCWKRCNVIEVTTSEFKVISDKWFLSIETLISHEIRQCRLNVVTSTAENLYSVIPFLLSKWFAPRTAVLGLWAIRMKLYIIINEIQLVFIIFKTFYQAGKLYLIVCILYHWNLPCRLRCPRLWQRAIAGIQWPIHGKPIRRAATIMGSNYLVVGKERFLGPSSQRYNCLTCRWGSIVYGSSPRKWKTLISNARCLAKVTPCGKDFRR